MNENKKQAILIAIEEAISTRNAYIDAVMLDKDIVYDFYSTIEIAKTWGEICKDFGNEGLYEDCQMLIARCEDMVSTADEK